MTTPETRVKRKYRKWVDENLPGAFRYAAPGGPFGVSGTSDDIGWWRGVPFAIEAKADETSELTPLQKHRMRAMKAAGAVTVALLGYQEWKLLELKRIILERSKGWDDSKTVPVQE